MNILKGLLLLLAVIVGSAVLQGSDKIKKKRLSDGINSYQHITTPILSADSRSLYFSRKLYFRNTGGVYDPDDIWYSEQDNWGNWQSAKLLADSINSEDSDVLFSLSPDGTRALLYGIYDRYGKKPGFSVSNIRNGIWGRPRKLKIMGYYNKSDNYSAHLSFDANVLILAIERKDSYGDLDLYVSLWDEKKQRFSVPKNMGAQINSKQAETSSYLSYDGRTLFFSSNRSGGAGQLDIYCSRRLDDSWTKWSEPKNVGEPYNSQYNESSFCFSKLSDTLYYVSSDTSCNLSAIYRSCFNPSNYVGDYKVVYGNISTVLNNSKVQVAEPLSIIVQQGDYRAVYNTSDNRGSYMIVLPGSGEYSLRIEGDGYESYEDKLFIKEGSGISYMQGDIVISRDQSHRGPVAVILFDKDKYNLPLHMENRIFEAMSQFDDISKLRFEVRGHADEQGSTDYNYELSRKRCETVSDYLEKLGIAKDMIHREPKGESEPVSSDMLRNRRVEIFIQKQ